MKVGDLVRYQPVNILSKRKHGAVGIILRTPEQTNNGDFEVCWVNRYNGCKTIMYSRGRLLELVK